MLTVKDLVVHYGLVRALANVSIEVKAGEIVAMIGANGSGKTTLLNTIAGLLSPTAGTIEFQGRQVGGLHAEQVVRLGISLAPAGHITFPDSTVYANLEAGAHVRNDKAGIEKDIQATFKRFPNLDQRRNQKAGLLSGGEQQMLTISRVVMSHPKLLLLDEPSAGLAPAVIQSVFQFIRQIRDEGTTILLVEQNARQALRVADRTYVLTGGRVVLHGTSEELMKDESVQKAYFGGVRRLRLRHSEPQHVQKR